MGPCKHFGGAQSWAATALCLYITYFTVAVGPLWKQDTLDITVEKRGPRQMFRLPSHKNTAVHNPDNDLI